MWKYQNSRPPHPYSQGISSNTALFFLISKQPSPNQNGQGGQPYWYFSLQLKWDIFHPGWVLPSNVVLTSDWVSLTSFLRHVRIGGRASCRRTSRPRAGHRSSPGGDTRSAASPCGRPCSRASSGSPTGWSVWPWTEDCSSLSNEGQINFSFSSS